MFGFRRRAEGKRRQAATLKAGEEAGLVIFAAVDTYLNHRLPEISNNLLGVLRERLTTIYDESEHSPATVAEIEFQIFMENLANYPAQLKQQVSDNVCDWLDVASTIGVRNVIDGYIDKRIDDALTALRLEGLRMTAETVAPTSAITNDAGQ